jgi:tetratricopeptide (TPR) repeat protein
MADAGDEGLAELIAREQRGFRRILFAGLATLLVMALTSAALGVYLSVAAQSLAETTRSLQRHAFDTRRNVDAQNNRILAQELAIRRIYDEIRMAAGEADVAPTPENIAAAEEAARAFLLRGRIPTLDEQRALDQFGDGSASQLSPAQQSLLAGVANLVSYETRGETIADDAVELPMSLSLALADFDVADNDPALAPIASAGKAWVLFEDASSGRRNYAAPACRLVFEAIAASAEDGSPGPQPLYWRAQCERKLGLTSDALADYARALRANPAANGGGDVRPDAAELTLAMNAYHGVGTTLIAGADVPESTPGMAEALAIAGEACRARPDYAARSQRMALALSCLDQAIALRRALGQSANQLSGSAENISFAHLRDGDFNAAFANATAVERTGLFPWNELVRALTAARATFEEDADRRAAVQAEMDARTNVSMFTVGQFNLCELRALFDEDAYQAAIDLIQQTHPGADVSCAPPV